MRKAIEISRTQLWLALAISAIALTSGLVLWGTTLNFSPVHLLTSLPACILFIAVAAVIIRSSKSSYAAADAINPGLAAGSSKEALSEPRPPVNEREIYGIYAALQTLSASLDLPDTLTLVADHLDRLVRDVTVVISLRETESEPLLVAGVFGLRADSFPLGQRTDENSPAVASIKLGGPITGSVLIANASPESDQREKHSFPAIAVPLSHDNTVIGAITLVRNEIRDFEQGEVNQFESVGIFAAPGIHNALARRRSHESAMTDPFMLMPNNRAAHTILDQRIAESLRRRNSEPVGVVCINLKSDEDESSQDAELKQLCPLVSDQLRQMDILARGERNELLIILPRAAESEAKLVADRIRGAMETQLGWPTRLGQFEMGIASFPQDGETANEIFNRARAQTRSDTLGTLTGTIANVVALDQYR